MEDAGIFYRHLVHFMVFCYILWTFGIVCGNLVYFSRFGILYQEKCGNPVSKTWWTLLILARFEPTTASATSAALTTKLLRAP
jgi:hypothetical protein